MLAVKANEKIRLNLLMDICMIYRTELVAVGYQEDAAELNGGFPSH
jgi:hypothetical protein